ncbi:YrhB domain-containing protein [Kitasatospora sp. NBC_01287]|uniref:YrhB domain-containing protein n=1 Tax=Kitasatospora sp. NBC_01287 TaxID=2903573 RepID=UPI002255773C|nr:YrhB domain-containing protein [Kitasatospora sp. NBC_01287]MCX4747439.1 YrhB domain-containing protein [Kitasatospora sp. NBC_01287]
MPLSVNEATVQARSWLAATYRSQVELAVSQPVAQSPEAYLYSCRVLPQPGFRPTPMLSASLVVPVNGTGPFHPATDRPWADLASLGQDSRPRTLAGQAHRLNARGCVVVMDGMIDGVRSSVLPWQPYHEAPGWWSRMLRHHFGQAEVAVCGNWDELIGAVQASGPDTRGVVWVRREIGGEEATGHLLYVHNNQGNAVVLDPLAGGLARLELEHVRRLTLARFRRDVQPEAQPQEPWRRRAPDFHAAKHKAQAWLDQQYGGQVLLVDPQPADEGSRGWLFACNTQAFLAGGRREDALLDAALVVPKDARAPFSLPNSSPWTWYTQWSSGRDDQPLPPAPAPLDWLDRTMSSLGGLIRVTDHTDWPTLLAELVTLPTGVRALVWVRRRDGRGRESVGLLLNAALTERGLVLLDPTTGEPATLEGEDVSSMHLLRYR